MTKYHVGCGLLGIYAGTLEPKNKYVWKNKNDVTDEAVKAVLQYFKDEMEDRKEKYIHAKYTFSDGTLLNLEISISSESVTE